MRIQLVGDRVTDLIDALRRVDPDAKVSILALEVCVEGGHRVVDVRYFEENTEE